MQITGVICYAIKYNREIRFTEKHRELIELALDKRLSLALDESKPILLNAFEMVHLKLLVIAIAKEKS